MAPNRWELKPESLRAVCDPDQLGFETTLDLTPLKEKVVARTGLTRLEFGLGVKDLEYNIFVAGATPGREDRDHRGLSGGPGGPGALPPDYIYVYNFRDPEMPRASVCPKAWRVLKADMEELISALKVQIPRSSKARTTPTAGSPDDTPSPRNATPFCRNWTPRRVRRALSSTSRPPG